MLNAEFSSYKRMISGCEILRPFILTEFFYEHQEKCKKNILALLEDIKKYDKEYAKTYKKNFIEFENAYRGYILYLYSENKLIIEDGLFKREDVRMFFGIHKKNVSFSMAEPVVIVNT